MYTTVRAITAWCNDDNKRNIAMHGWIFKRNYDTLMRSDHLINLYHASIHLYTHYIKAKFILQPWLEI